MTPIIAAILVSGALAPVELRGAGAPVIDSPVLEVSIRGVSVAGDPARLIGWDEIRRVTGERAAEAAPFASICGSGFRAPLSRPRNDAEDERAIASNESIRRPTP